MLTVRDLIKLWPNAEAFAADLGLKNGGSHARVMKMRGSIPRVYWPAMVEAAGRRGFALTEEQIKTAHASAAELETVP
jgi:hypothetical protein